MKEMKSSGDYIDFISENTDIDKLWLIRLTNQAKQEVFDDIENNFKLKNENDFIILDGEYKRLKQRHLSKTQSLDEIAPSESENKDFTAHSDSPKFCPCECHKGGLLDDAVQSLCLDCCKKGKTS